MQPTNPMQPRGSFVKPQNIMKAMEQQVEAAPPAQAPVPPSQAVQAPQATPTSDPVTEGKAAIESDIEKEEKERVERLATIKASIEKDLETTISDSDVQTYLFKGVLAKEVTIIPGKMKGTFTTLRIKDIQEIDSRMATIRDSAKNTQQGLSNEESILALSYAWTHAAGRPLGTSPADREAKIRDMGSLFIESASTARVRFDTLLRISMNDPGIVKK